MKAPEARDGDSAGGRREPVTADAVHERVKLGPVRLLFQFLTIGLAHGSCLHHIHADCVTELQRLRETAGRGRRG